MPWRAQPLEDAQQVAEATGETRWTDLDEDDADKEEAIEHIRACLSSALSHSNPRTAVVLIPSLLLKRVGSQAQEDLPGARSLSTSCSSSPHALIWFRRKTGSFYRWVGEKADPSSGRTSWSTRSEPRGNNHAVRIEEK